MDAQVLPSIQLMILRRHKIAAIHPNFKRGTLSVPDGIRWLSLYHNNALGVLAPRTPINIRPGRIVIFKYTFLKYRLPGIFQGRLLI